VRGSSVSEAYNSSATREIPRILWQSEVYYRVYIICSYPIHMNSVHAFSLYFSNILLILSVYLRVFPKWYLPLRNSKLATLHDIKKAIEIMKTYSLPLKIFYLAKIH